MFLPDRGRPAPNISHERAGELVNNLVARGRDS
jgi:hypothetical protein